MDSIIMGGGRTSSNPATATILTSNDQVDDLVFYIREYEYLPSAPTNT